MEALFGSSPSLRRLRWLLDGLDGDWSADAEASDILASEFTAIISAERFVAVMQERATRLKPIRVVGIDAEDNWAVARFRGPEGMLWVARVEVEAEHPHRIVSAYAQPSVPDYLTPALPRKFSIDDFPGRPAVGATLMVFSGVPGTGKSTVAEQVGARLGRPVFALDWLLGALSPFGMRHRSDLMRVGEELLTTFAYRELSAGRSAIIDTTSEDVTARGRWKSLAAASGALFLPVVCVCSDPAQHRERVERRHRGIPGWADAGDWADVRSRSAAFPTWTGALVVDTVAPLPDCVSRVLAEIREVPDAAERE